MKIEINRFGKPHVPNMKSRKERHALVGVAVFLIFVVLIITGFTIGIEKLLKCYVVVGQEATWDASVLSYWGGILGGVISGLLAFLGVFYTIRYYKESDAQKERAAVQPFLFVGIMRDIRHEPSKGYTLGKNVKSDSRKEIYVQIKNIGNGFAKTLVLHTGFNIGGIEYNRVINVGESEYTYFVVNEEDIEEEISFAIQYIDSMTNEYVQEYIVKKEQNSTVIESGYPRLIK